MEHLRIGLVQFPRDRQDLEGNVTRMLQMVSGFKAVDMVVLPEDWMGALVVDLPCYLEVMDRLQEQAYKGNFCLVMGAQYIREAEKIYSRGAVLHPTEGVMGWVEKQFPSAAIQERQFIQAGRPSQVFQFKGVNFGVVVCVDIMYPELVRHLALGGAEVIFNPSNVVAGRSNLWERVGSTRAAENTVFVVMANNAKTSYPDGRPVEGHSFVAGPDGTVLTNWGSTEGCFTCNLNLDDIRRIRERWKYLSDIKADLQKVVERFYR
ncbi:MAG: carbon-nitrogen hydrolase family protein [Clostridia bacterium]|nr:carbon-nitrogen hydrolase family protein [Clostridia bacterium]